MDVANVPKVPYQGPEEEEANWVELYHRLFFGRYLFLARPLEKQPADQIMKSMIYLNQEDQTKDFMFFLHCRGGGMVQGVAVYDTMQYVTGDVFTIGVGLNASMGAFLVHGGTLTKRIMTQNASIMIHQPHMSPYDRRASSIESSFDSAYMGHLRSYVARTYLRTTKQDFELICFLLERDIYMTPKQAIEFGLIDEIGVEGLGFSNTLFVHDDDDEHDSSFAHFLRDFARDREDRSIDRGLARSSAYSAQVYARPGLSQGI
uniref:ATP-dependent Clp protease proteolytic subunit n=1 Tax=Glyptostrobus pensilis TaxID=28978 RepID=A0A1C8QIS9_9CONI|nr:ATP-dependent Clp protease proteolytic subunit [Glyptostrobus pensilis]ANT70617.1 ATP-dependent Clp protease proteolytic subunit [Glyptostrobus pensilis]QYB21553.1 clp protease proteolytic subunit [Glyptostrobus pensilis]WLN32132.1 ATP-dependent Clp protease proteolytic subunit [Glyptostrobus pensilis]